MLERRLGQSCPCAERSCWQLRAALQQPLQESPLGHTSPLLPAERRGMGLPRLERVQRQAGRPWGRRRQGRAGCGLQAPPSSAQETAPQRRAGQAAQQQLAALLPAQPLQQQAQAQRLLQSLLQSQCPGALPARSAQQPQRSWAEAGSPQSALPAWPALLPALQPGRCLLCPSQERAAAWQPEQPGSCSSGGSDCAP